MSAKIEILIANQKYADSFGTKEISQFAQAESLPLSPAWTPVLIQQNLPDWQKEMPMSFEMQEAVLQTIQYAR